MRIKSSLRQPKCLSSPSDFLTMLIYSPENNARLQYILDLIFNQLLGIPYQMTHLQQEFIHYEGPRLNYSFESVAGHPFLEASGLLYERQVYDQQEVMGPVFQWNELPAFFPASDPSILPFDLFSAAFYLVSRYEEYLPYTPDIHRRFPSAESLAYRENFLDQPVVNSWALALEKVLKALFPNQIQTNKPGYRFLPTFDIDNAWAFRHKGFRSLASFFKPATMFERNYRYQVLTRNQPDPYDQYVLIQTLSEKHQVHPVFFFLLGKPGKYDRNVAPSSRALHKLIRQLQETFEIGIHPSYRSGNNQARLRKEIDRLSRITGQPVIHSRQHFLKFELPDTYRRLEALGIEKEYSMGYPDRSGFRASIASPFRFFDLEHNRSSRLTVIPFQIMDVTLQQYLKLEPEAAIRQIREMNQRVRAVGGLFSILWHNESLSEWKHWEGWSAVFRETLAIAAP